jgi:hypothetical protein
MKTACTVLRILVRLIWLILLVLGAVLWTGRDQSLIAAHEFLGVAFVLVLWALAYLGVRCGVRRIYASSMSARDWRPSLVVLLSAVAPGLVGTLFLWGLVLLVFGMTQTRILNGSSHWIIQVLHLLAGVVAIGLAEVLGARIKRRLAGPV